MPIDRRHSPERFLSIHLFRLEIRKHAVEEMLPFLDVCAKRLSTIRGIHRH